MNNQARSLNSQHTTYTQRVNGSVTFNNVIVKKPYEKGKMGNSNSVSNHVVSPTNNLQKVNGVNRETMIRHSSSGGVNRETMVRHSSSGGVNRETMIRHSSSGGVENCRQPVKNRDGFYGKRKSAESVVQIVHNEMRGNNKLQIKNSLKTYSNIKKSKENGVIRSHSFAKTTQILHHNQTQKSPKWVSSGYTSQKPQQQQQSCDRNQSRSKPVRQQQQQQLVRKENKPSMVVDLTDDPDAGLLLKSAYSEPLAANDLFSGNHIKARQADGKLYRGTIVEVIGTSNIDSCFVVVIVEFLFSLFFHSF